MNRLYTSDLFGFCEYRCLYNIEIERTICFASIATVFILNLREHMSNKSSRLGPSISITKIL
jgi:hypothetical protein